VAKNPPEGEKPEEPVTPGDRKPINGAPRRKAVYKAGRAGSRSRSRDRRTGNPVGRPKADLTDVPPKKGVQPHKQPAYQQGNRERAFLRTVGFDPFTKKPLEFAEVHDHPWSTLQSMEAAGRSPAAIATSLNTTENRGEKKFNFRARNVGPRKWEIQRQNAFCSDCDPKNPNATEQPPLGLIA
jgi:hypothetical protein